MGDIHVPVSIWCGSGDEQAGKYAEILGREMPTAERIPYTGGHIPPPSAYRDLLRWLGGTLA